LALERLELLVVEVGHARLPVDLVVMLDVDVRDRVRVASRALRVPAQEVDLQDVAARVLRNRGRELHRRQQLVHVRARLGLDAETAHGFRDHRLALDDVGLGLHHVLVERQVYASRRRLGRRQLHRLAELHEHLRAREPGARTQEGREGGAKEHQAQYSEHEAPVLEYGVEHAADRDRRGRTARGGQERGRVGKRLQGRHAGLRSSPDYGPFPPVLFSEYPTPTRGSAGMSPRTYRATTSLAVATPVFGTKTTAV